VACPLLARIVNLKRHPLLGYGTIKSDATKEHITLRNATNGSTAGNSVFCGSEPIVTSCNNIGIVGSGVFC
jgi:hypothetical protein